MRKQNKGITLIALVITIIVLLILAGVSMATLTGENGILNQADKAKTETDEKKALEALQLETAGSFDEQGNYQLSLAKQNLEKNLNISTNDITDNNDGTVWVKYKGYNFFIDIYGKVFEESLRLIISPTNYGDYINYNVDLNDDEDITNDWRIFYKDGENVFIIAADYLPNTKLPSKTDMGTYTDYSYSAYWPSESNLTRVGSSAISETVANKYMLSWKNTYSTSENNNIKAVATLLDTRAWSSLATGVSGAEAIGAPTLEMYVASWNAKKHTTIYCNNSTSTGYFIGIISNPTNYFINNMSLDANGYADTLYYPHRSGYNNCYGYWLASPSSSSTNTMMSVYCDGYVGSNNRSYELHSKYNNNCFGVRPVVCLPSEIKGNQGADGIWTIVQ